MMRFFRSLFRSGGDIGARLDELAIYRSTNALALHPNPASLYVTLQLDAMPCKGVVVVRDALGRVALGQTWPGGTIVTMDIRTLPAGPYTLEVLDKDRRMATARLFVE